MFTFSSFFSSSSSLLVVLLRSPTEMCRFIPFLHSHCETEHILFSFRYDLLFFFQLFSNLVREFTQFRKNNCITTLAKHFSSNGKHSSSKYSSNCIEIQFSSVIWCENGIFWYCNNSLFVFCLENPKPIKKTAAAARSNGLTEILYLLPRTKSP